MNYAINFAWKLPLFAFFVAVGEWWLHKHVLHSPRFMKLPWKKHAQEHHLQGKNHLKRHIDLDAPDYLIGLPFIVFAVLKGMFWSPYGWCGAAAGLVVFSCHWYLWSKLHRAIHQLEDNWTSRIPWYYPACEKHHVDHHESFHRGVIKNYAVVFLFTDWLFCSRYDGRSWKTWVAGDSISACLFRFLIPWLLVALGVWMFLLMQGRD